MTQPCCRTQCKMNGVVLIYCLCIRRSRVTSCARCCVEEVSFCYFGRPIPKARLDAAWRVSDRQIRSGSPQSRMHISVADVLAAGTPHSVQHCVLQPLDPHSICILIITTQQSRCSVA